MAAIDQETDVLNGDPDEILSKRTAELEAGLDTLNTKSDAGARETAKALGVATPENLAAGDTPQDETARDIGAIPPSYLLDTSAITPAAEDETAGKLGVTPPSQVPQFTDESARQLAGLPERPTKPAHTWDAISSTDTFKALPLADKVSALHNWTNETRDYAQSLTGANADAVDESLNKFLVSQHGALVPRPEQESFTKKLLSSPERGIHGLLGLGTDILAQSVKTLGSIAGEATGSPSVQATAEGAGDWLENIANEQKAAAAQGGTSDPLALTLEKLAPGSTISKIYGGASEGTGQAVAGFLAPENAPLLLTGGGGARTLAAVFTALGVQQIPQAWKQFNAADGLQQKTAIAVQTILAIAAPALGLKGHAAAKVDAIEAAKADLHNTLAQVPARMLFEALHGDEIAPELKTAIRGALKAQDTLTEHSRNVIQAHRDFQAGEVKADAYRKEFGEGSEAARAQEELNRNDFQEAMDKLSEATPEAAPSAAEAAAGELPAGVELPEGVRYDGVQEGKEPLHQFTDTNEGTPSHGATFYLKEGELTTESLAEKHSAVQDRFNQAEKKGGENTNGRSNTRQSENRGTGSPGLSAPEGRQTDERGTTGRRSDEGRQLEGRETSGPRDQTPNAGKRQGERLGSELKERQPVNESGRGGNAPAPSPLLSKWHEKFAAEQAAKGSPEEVSSRTREQDQTREQANGGTVEELAHNARRDLDKQIKLPKGASSVRVTDAKGRKSILSERDLKGANPLHEAGPFTKIEAGTIAKGNKFEPMKEPVELREQPMRSAAEDEQETAVKNSQASHEKATSQAAAEALQEHGSTPTPDLADQVAKRYNVADGVLREFGLEGNDEARTRVLDTLRDDIFKNIEETGEPFKTKLESGEIKNYNTTLVATHQLIDFERLKENKTRSAAPFHADEKTEGLAVEEKAAAPQPESESTNYASQVQQIRARAISAFTKWVGVPLNAAPKATRDQITRAAGMVTDDILSRRQKALAGDKELTRINFEKFAGRGVKGPIDALRNDPRFVQAVRQKVIRDIRQDSIALIGKDRDVARLASGDVTPNEALKKGAKLVKDGMPLDHVIEMMPDKIKEQVQETREKFGTDSGINGALEKIAKTIPVTDEGQMQQALAEALSKVGDNIPVEVDPFLGQRGANGEYFRGKIKLSSTLSDSTAKWALIHEKIHPILKSKITAYLKGDQSNLSRSDVNALDELSRLRQIALDHESTPESIRDAAKANSAGVQFQLFQAARAAKLADVSHYGLLNLHEFVGEAVSNSAFQKFLNKIEAPAGLRGGTPENISIWGRVKDLFRQLVLGGPETNANSILPRAFDRAIDLIKSGEDSAQAEREAAPLRSPEEEMRIDAQHQSDFLHEFATSHGFDDANHLAVEDPALFNEAAGQYRGQTEEEHFFSPADTGAGDEPNARAEQLYKLVDDKFGIDSKSVADKAMAAGASTKNDFAAAFKTAGLKSEMAEAIGQALASHLRMTEAAKNPHPFAPESVKTETENAVNSPTGTVGSLAKEAAGGWWDRVKTTAGAAMNKTFPKTTLADQASGEKMARWISSRQAAPFVSNRFVAEVLKGTDIDGNKFGAALSEDNLRSIKQNLLDHDSQEAADKVRSLIGADKPFKTEQEYQKFLADPAIQQAIQRHVAQWDKVIEPLFKAAMKIDPDLELPSRGLQTGARVNLFATKEEQAALASTGVAGAKTGNLRGTMERLSPFGRQAKGTGTYNTNYADMMANTVGRQYEIANKNAFEKQLVESGHAIIGKPGENPTLADGEDTRGFPLKTKTVITKDGKAVPLNRELFVRKSLAGEYERAADVNSKPLPQEIVNLITTPLNNAALAGFTDFTVHVSNLFTALTTRPSMTGSLLRDSLLSATGRADAFVSLGKLVIKSLKDNEGQLEELAQIGALRESHPTGGKYNPLTYSSKAIKWMDQSTRLMLDDAYKQMVKDGWAVDTETARREFVNQVGQYNRRGQNAFIRLARDTGVGPFATAGTTFNALGVRMATLSPGVEATSGLAAAAMRANVLSKWVGAGVLIGALNYALVGKMTGRAGVPFGNVDTGRNNANGQPLSVPVFDLLGLGRALRVTGARGAIEAYRKGLTNADIADASVRDIWNSQISPFAGPPIRFGMSLANFTPFMSAGGTIKPSPSTAPGESQSISNLVNAIVGANPVAASIREYRKGAGLYQAVQSQFPRFVPKASQPEQMMANYPEIVHKARAADFIGDVTHRARYMEPAARTKFIKDALSRLAPADRPKAIQTLRWHRVPGPYF